MKDMDNIKTVKKEWVCKSGTDDQILNGTEQNCDYFVDNLFEEAQKVGAMCMPPTTVKNQVDVIIKLWKNGFTVNDGELRSYTDVANQQFLDSIKKGELPFELQKVFDKEEVEVKVEDKKDKVYLSSKKPMFHPFSGHGYRLGRISHVRDFITKYQGSEGSVPFTLTTSLPFRELQDETLTLEEAKLQNAVVVQRLRKTTEPFRLLVIKAPDNDYKSAATPNGQLKNEPKNAINSTRSN
ncbi:UBX domain-containing protein 2A isoform X3 [Haemorhous mexicanus]|uniref:UBX domain-containing protein 2A isoform X3 n=1 Tax=Haemorhous mexicanus TaxID=30427 RepID=UPI0028BDB605|nr:UBX domain-containing protein 2A isoform X3 [Haemorhous mexicanus]